MTLAIFDFDGTISNKDSFIQFILYTHGEIKAILTMLMLSPWIALHQLGMLPNGKLKEYTLTALYNGLEEENFKKIAVEFAQNNLPKMIKASALERIAWHKKMGHKVVIVSASPEDYLKYWAGPQGIDVIATKIEFKLGRVTGLLDGKNCYGEEKVRRLEEKYNLKDFEFIYAYGDTKGDRALQKIANEFHYRSFK